MRKSLKDRYKKLPEKNFQADLNSTNIMVDNNLRFKGIIDYNISGMEKIINYSLAESFKPLTLEDMEIGILSRKRINARDRELYKNLNIIEEYYIFTNAEREILNNLYNLTIPFRWINYIFYNEIFIKEDIDESKKILNYIYFEIMREDIKY